MSSGSSAHSRGTDGDYFSSDGSSGSASQQHGQQEGSILLKLKQTVSTGFSRTSAPKPDDNPQPFVRKMTLSGLTASGAVAQPNLKSPNLKSKSMFDDGKRPWSIMSPTAAMSPAAASLSGVTKMFGF